MVRVSISTESKLPKPYARLSFCNLAVLQYKFQKVAVLGVTHEYEILRTPLEYAVHMHHMRMVQLCQNVELSGKKFSDEVLRCHLGIYHLARQSAVSFRI